ncbi:hypothetical protein CHLNCDRAFT_144105 [Chlorella variabilis]|uniref:Uroporphyrinogen-III synthase n=1 Tax=Chlorella variabilis TaxID=554065 RepID=E1ZBX1_CHLVA|nr:hypothetical protein CHLNCDRAFT_144105 [Chlorella variabilis]EFN56504.1 hypothetical protein CHLNCDRAFT_144105 [Chlorella variabilis]|eukprot:XP_005848606.1 hypothetical protein CHLNCDRAFT_144105 [Chlorella variabilis]
MAATWALKLEQQLRVPTSASVAAASRSATSCTAVLAAAAAASGDAQVVLTRAQGKNGKLRRVLEGRGIACFELPMLETAAGPDRDRLPKANAEHFGPELPFLEGGTKRVLYPASNKASSELQSDLAARGFDMVCLNIYETVPVTRLDERQLAAARRAAVVTVGSPSAMLVWA